MAFCASKTINIFSFIVCFVWISTVLCATLSSPHPENDEDTVIVDDVIVNSSEDGNLSEPSEITTPSALVRDKICKLPLARGHCRALLPRWRYDPKTQSCQEFKFGGCDGNGNNFMTEKDCLRICQGV